MKVLFINCPQVACGVGQFGKRIYELASRSDKVDYYYKVTPTREYFEEAVNIIKPEFVLWNYHWDRIPWLNVQDLKNHPESKHYFCWHDGSMISYYDKYLFFGEYDPGAKAVPVNKRVLLPRPLFEYAGEYPKNELPTIGSFGFCSNNKRYPELVTLVNQTFDKAVINFHITRPWFGDNHGFHLMNIVDACKRNNTNPNVQLNISTDFMNDEGLLTFLAGNDINVFYYTGDNNPGISAAVDYALSVKRPIAVTKASLLRHIANKDNTLENNTLQEILSKGLQPVEQYHQRWSIENYVTQLDNLFLEGR